jgi:hypothetical protein
VSARSKAWTVFASKNTGILGSNPTQDMDVCARLFCVCVVLCVRSGHATGWSPVQGVQPTVYRWKSGQGPKGCRVIQSERERDPNFFNFDLFKNPWGSESYWTLFSTQDGKRNLHTEELIEYKEHFFHFIAHFKAGTAKNILVHWQKIGIYETK